LIKLLLSGKQLLLFIIIAWSLLAFVGYNVLTVQAAEKDDKKVCESYGGEWKETIRVDVDGNEKGSGEKQCNFNNDKDLQAYSIRPGHSLDGTGSDAEYGRLDLDMSDDEAAAIEDDICDDEDADYTNIELCMSDKRKDVEKEMKKACDDTDNAKWTQSGCVVDEAEPTEERKELDKEMYSSKTFKNLLASKGIDYDDYKNDKLSSEKRDELETEFREDKSDEYAEEINKDNKEDEGKRYVNPDGGAPLYEDELTEEEKGYYEEYKPEKEQKNIEDWGNTVSYSEEEQIQNEENEITPEEAESYVASISDEEQNEEEVADNNEEDDSQVNTDTEDSPDNTESSDSQDSSESEDDGDDSSDSGDDSSSSDDGGDSGDSSESEE
jgi:hypothetical protein